MEANPGGRGRRHKVLEGGSVKETLPKAGSVEILGTKNQRSDSSDGHDKR